MFIQSLKYLLADVYWSYLSQDLFGRLGNVYFHSGQPFDLLQENNQTLVNVDLKRECFVISTKQIAFQALFGLFD